MAAGAKPNDAVNRTRRSRVPRRMTRILVVLIVGLALGLTATTTAAAVGRPHTASRVTADGAGPSNPECLGSDCGAPREEGGPTASG